MSASSLRGRLIIFTLTRTIINTGFRLVYPFLATFSRALGVDVEAIALAVTARSALGLAGPIFGNLGDSLGRKRAMLLGIACFSIGFGIVVLYPTYPTFFAALLLGTTGKIIFDPAMQAYLGDHVAYHRRSAAIAITEIGWSGASLIGLPFVGWLIASRGWLAPFPTLGGLTLICLVLVWRALPEDPQAQVSGMGVQAAWRSITQHPAAVAALATTLLLSIGNESVNIVYGLWLEGSFGLQVAALGAASSVIGFAELSGEGFVATLTDRLGKTRAVTIGLLLTGLACLLLPILGQTLTGVLVGLFLFYLSFEFTFVSLIPLISELVPTARATLMAGNLAAAAAGRAVGAYLGPQLYAFGIFTNATLGAFLTFLAILVLRRWVKVE
jgi:predicted MFS family arabinose efflux permease